MVDSKKIIVALDFSILDDALAFVDNIDPSLHENWQRTLQNMDTKRY